jgi:hypothetical protein
MKTFVLAASILALSTAPALAAPSMATPPAAPVAAPAFYRLDVSISGVDDAPKPQPIAYTLLLEENQKESIHTGWNIPYSTGSNTTMRQSLGLSMNFELALRGGTPVLEGEVEMELVEPNSPASSPVWHQVKAQSAVPVVQGQPTLFTSVYDIASKRRYEVTVTAKRV